MALYSRGAFLTFRNVPIPASTASARVVIHKAYIEFTATERLVNEYTTLNAIVTGHCAADSWNPTVFDYEPVQNHIATEVEWADVEAWELDNEYQTPNIACVIQEIVRLEGWASGNDMTLLVEEDGTSTKDFPLWPERNAYDYGADTAKATRLEIWWGWEYTETGSGGVEVGGRAETGDTIIPIDGVEIGGRSVPFGTIDETADGGVDVGGEAEFDVAFNPSVSDGVEIGGVGGVSQHIGVSGGVEMGGVATVADFVAMQGGVSIGQGSYANGYHYRLKIVVPPGAVAEDFDKFYFGVNCLLNPDTVETGSDFLVTDIADTALAHELRNYDGDTGRVHLFVKTPLATEGNEFWLYWGRE